MQDKEGGTRYTTEIIAREMKMLGGKGNEQQAGESYSPPSAGDDVLF